MSLGLERGGPRVVSDGGINGALARLSQMGEDAAQWLRRIIRPEHRPAWAPAEREKEEGN